MQNDPVKSIRNVIKKRIGRGASKENIEVYQNHLLAVWKSEYMQNAIRSINYDAMVIPERRVKA